MKAIILAAGQGIRLLPLTANRPKCMVNFKGQPIIDHILSTLKTSGIEDIVIVNGHEKMILESHLRDRKIHFITNNRYAETNMVYTFFCAEKEMDDDLIVSYADIVYSPEILNSLIQCDSGLSIVVDKDWQRLWQARMSDPLNDAETMKLDDTGHIIEFGKKPLTYADIQGQYIGLFKISKEILTQVCSFYRSLDTHAIYDGKDFDNMFMTSFLQALIDHGVKAKAVPVSSGWVEIDTLDDLENLQNFI